MNLETLDISSHEVWKLKFDDFDPIPSYLLMD